MCRLIFAEAANGAWVSSTAVARTERSGSAWLGRGVPFLGGGASLFLYSAARSGLTSGVSGKGYLQRFIGFTPVMGPDTLSGKPAASMPVPTRSVRIFLVAATALLLWAGWSIYWNLFADEPQYRVAASYWASGDAANDRRDPYAPQPLTVLYQGANGRALPDLNLNPPFLLPLFQLLALGSPAATFYILVVGSYVLFVATAAWVLRGHPTMPEPCIVLLVLGAPMLDTLVWGQIYVVLFVLGAVTWWAFENGRSWPAAISIGMLIAIKPILFLWPLYLWVAGKRRMAVGSFLVASAATLSAVPLYGPKIFLQWIRASSGDEHYVIPFDISMPAVFRRMGQGQVGYVLAAALFVAVLVYVWRKKPTVSTVSVIAVCTALLCSPLAWIQYLVILFPAIAVEANHRWKPAAVILLSVPTYFPRLLAAAPGFRRVVGQLLLFTPCCLLLAWYLDKARMEQQDSRTVAETEGSVLG